MQRVSIGRGLVRSPGIHLTDEPLSSLDAKLRAELRAALKRIQVLLGATLLYVTHDQVEAMAMATRIKALNRGRLVQFGSPREIYDDPASLHVGGRLGVPRINALPAGLLPGAATVGPRPEHVREGDGLAVVVVRIERLGDQTRLHPDLEGHSLVALADPHAAEAR